MRFQVPQFIEIEDKVIGPLSFKQFVYLAGGAGLSFVLYVFLPLLIAIPLIGAAIALAVSLAFYQVNNKPFIFLLEAAVRYFTGARLYVWHKATKKPVSRVAEKISEQTPYVPKLSDSKLKDLSWSLDVEQFEGVDQTDN